MQANADDVWDCAEFKTSVVQLVEQKCNVCFKQDTTAPLVLTGKMKYGMVWYKIQSFGVQRFRLRASPETERVSSTARAAGFTSLSLARV